MGPPPRKETPRGGDPRERGRRESVDPDRDRSDEGGERKERKQAETTKAGLLAHNAAYAKSNTQEVRAFGFQQGPSLAEIIERRAEPKGGEPLAEILPQARMPVHPDLPEAELRPPPFLSPQEAMSDVYMRTRGRMTNKTKLLLEGPELEDLIGMLTKLHANEGLARNVEARLKHAISSKLKNDPGPLLIGLNDKRLTEPWRLFLDRWDIWVPEDEDAGGVELFWEGEGEADDEDSGTIEILQSLTFSKGELTLYAKFGNEEDRITFDGETFYRLKS